MSKDLKNVRELYDWNKHALLIGGIWPLKPNFIHFYTCYVYFIFNVILAYGDFVHVFGNMTLMIANLLETSILTMFGVKMLVLRYSMSMKLILKQLEAGAEESNYRNDEEKKLYLEYNAIGRAFFQVGHYLALGTCFIYHLRPFDGIVNAVLHNETIPYVLPYRIFMFFNMTDVKTYVLVYILQSPMIYYYYGHAFSVCFFCTLIVHVAGELSVLAHRIRHINQLDSSNVHCSPEIAFREIIIKHKNIIRTANAIDDAFNFVLLEELGISTMLIGLTAYSVIAESLMVSMIDLFFLISYSMALILLILIYCITGEFLICESMNVHDAYYECQWYTMPTKYRTYMIICMTRARKPLQVTAGSFYVFSLSQFSGVLKTSMAYISMLRTV